MSNSRRLIDLSHVFNFCTQAPTRSAHISPCKALLVKAEHVNPLGIEACNNRSRRANVGDGTRVHCVLEHVLVLSSLVLKFLPLSCLSLLKLLTHP
jgi:hypothetical protein